MQDLKIVSVENGEFEYKGRIWGLSEDPDRTDVLLLKDTRTPDERYWVSTASLENFWQILDSIVGEHYDVNQ